MNTFNNHYFKSLDTKESKGASLLTKYNIDDNDDDGFN